MPAMPGGVAPPIPGLTETSGVSPDSISPMTLMAMMMGLNPGKEDTVGQKIEQVIRLLRELGQGDPKMAPLAMDALRALTEGLPQVQAPSGPPVPNRGSVGGGPGGMVG